MAVFANPKLRLLFAGAIALALGAMWLYGINRLVAFGFVPPVPGYWPVTMGPLNPKLVYYATIVLVWLGLTYLGVRQIVHLLRRDADKEAFFVDGSVD